MRQDLYTQMYFQEEYYWWHRAKRALIKKFLPSKPNLKIIDIGCGTGKLIEDLQDQGQIWGIDHSQKAINFCQKRGLNNIYLENFPKLTKVKKKFDVVTCLDVLEHIKNHHQAAKSINSLLKKNGIAIITVPAYPWLFGYWDQALGHYRRYTRQSLKILLEDSGFKINKISYVYSFLIPVVIPFRAIKQLVFKNKKSTSDFIEIPRFFHSVLFTISILEQWWLRLFNIPFGLSLICIAEKS